MPNSQPVKIPMYAKGALIIICTFALVYLLFIGREIMLPIAYASLFAILLNPFVEFFEKRKVPRILAAIVVLIISLGILAGLLYFISIEIAKFSDTFPQLMEKLNEISADAEKWVSSQFNIPLWKIDRWIAENKAKMLNSSGSYLGQGFTTITGIVLAMIIIPVYIIMILYYRPLIMEFVMRISPQPHREKVVEIMMQTKSIVQSYMRGLIIEGAIVAALNTGALLALGIRYAILLGILGALLNVIPFIGGILAVLLPVIIALVFKQPPLLYVVLVCVSYSVIQFIDNHFLIPKVVASKVKVNALISLIVVFIGAALWGIGGMFLAIPATGILKIVFDHVETLKPYGYLLGDSMPEPYQSAQWLNISHRIATRIKKATGIEQK